MSYIFSILSSTALSCWLSWRSRSRQEVWPPRTSRRYFKFTWLIPSFTRRFIRFPFSNQAEKEIKSYLITTLKEHYAAPDQANAVTTSWNLLQVIKLIKLTTSLCFHHSTSQQTTGTNVLLRSEQLHGLERHPVEKEHQSSCASVVLQTPGPVHWFQTRRRDVHQFAHRAQLIQNEGTSIVIII